MPFTTQLFHYAKLLLTLILSFGLTTCTFPSIKKHLDLKTCRVTCFMLFGLTFQSVAVLCVLLVRLVSRLKQEANRFLSIDAIFAMSRK